MRAGERAQDSGVASALRTLACAALFCAALGCDVPQPRVEEGPRLLAVTPLDGAEGVSRRTRVVFTFDRALQPSSVTSTSAVLVSGSRAMPVTRWVDPVSRTLTLELTGTAELLPDLRFRAVVDGVRDLDGRVAERIEIAFRTGTSSREPEPRPAPSFREIVEPLLRERCASEGCHGGATPVLGLDLSSGDAIARSAIAVPSVEAGEPPLPGSTLPGLGGMRRIEASAGVGFPERSYLVYKILGDPHVVGERMPPPSDAGGPGLSETEQQLIADWIRAGASLD